MPSGDVKERTTAEHGPSMVRVPEDKEHLRLEPCSAVVTGVLGVHTGMSGAFSGMPHRRRIVVLTEPRSSRFPSPIPEAEPNTSSATAAN